MIRYERIGFPKEKIHLDSEIASLINDAHAPFPFENSWCYYESVALRTCIVATYAFLMDDLSTAREWANRTIEFIDLHFDGEWRNKLPSGDGRMGPPSRDYHDLNTPWATAFQCGLLCGSCLQKWEWLKTLGSYIVDDIRGGISQTESNRAWYLFVAHVLRDRPWSEMTAFYEKTQNSLQKREKLLARLLHSIVEGTESDRAAATKEYFTHFKRSERKSEYINIMLPWDASFLVHYAKHVGKPLPVPSDVTDYIVDLGAE